MSILSGTNDLKMSDKEAREILDACSCGRREALRMITTLPLTQLFPPDEAALLVDENREMAERWQRLEQEVSERVATNSP